MLCVKKLSILGFDLQVGVWSAVKESLEGFAFITELEVSIRVSSYLSQKTTENQVLIKSAHTGARYPPFALQFSHLSQHSESNISNILSLVG